MAKGLLTGLGSFVITIRKAFVKPEKLSVYYRLFISDCMAILTKPFALTIFVSFFMGMVCAMLGIYMLASPIIPKYIVGYLVREMMFFELGALVTGAILANTLGYAITYDLGRKKRYDLIDCLDLMGINVEALYIQPQFFAFLLLVPCLVIFCCLFSLLGGCVYGQLSGLISAKEFFYGVSIHYSKKSLIVLFVKTYVFAATIPLVSSYLGLNFTGNSLELNRRATYSVTVNYITLMILDFIISCLIML